MISPREAAFEALTSSHYLETVLDRWAQEQGPETRDLAFARELAGGTARHLRSLDAQIAQHAKLPKDSRQRALLRLTLYQLLHMSVPPYAAINEGVKLARKHCPPRFAGFLNWVMRRLSGEEPISQPNYPEFFIGQIRKAYPAEADAILAAMDAPPTSMTRCRKTNQVLPGIPETLAPDAYVQNITQVELITRAAAQIRPTRILDLCAAPGGKTILLHDLFPEAELHANDLKECPRLQANLRDYRVPATLHTHAGEQFPDGGFDLVVIDAPCSNSGVLHKRPEARWRIKLETLKQLGRLQDRLIRRGYELLNPGGWLLYTTCSILPQEMRPMPGELLDQVTLLPDHSGRDGGSMCISRRT